MKYPHPDETQFSWIADGYGAEYNDETKFLVENRDKIEVIYGESNSRQYEFDDRVLIRIEEKYYLLTTAGCSCPIPSDVWCIEYGPSTLDDMFEYCEKNYSTFISILKDIKMENSKIKILTKKEVLTAQNFLKECEKLITKINGVVSNYKGNELTVEVTGISKLIIDKVLEEYETSDSGWKIRFSSGSERDYLYIS